ncbi:ATP-binding protein, partial [Klebsiella pneumoniae]
TRLVDQLLTLSRLDSLAQLDDVQQVAIADLLQSAVMEMYHPAQQSGIELRLHLNASHIVRTGQPLLLSLLVRNLLDNAVRYSPCGSQVDITLNAREFRVRDNGPGINPQALSRIGERFYRPPGQEAPGSGLGLSIVRRIASLHGMQVDFANARDGGFEARVYW